MERTIEVTGHGAATAPADSARLALTVAAQDLDVSSALGIVAQVVGRVSAAARAAGVDDHDVATEGVSVHPRYDPSGEPTRGFTAQHRLSLRLRALGEVGAQLASVVDAGNDYVRVDSLTLELADTSALEDRARQAAFTDARRRAEQLAALADVSLGEVLRAREGFEGGTARPMMFKMATESMPIEAGEQTVEVTLSVCFAAS